MKLKYSRRFWRVQILGFEGTYTTCQEATARALAYLVIAGVAAGRALGQEVT